MILIRITISLLMHDFRNMSNKLKDAEAKYNNDLWTLTDHVIMHLMGFNHTINPKDASL
jgi:ssRNA-specific RNase YbeY (16S rRNA maturation enzyme)